MPKKIIEKILKRKKVSLLVLILLLLGGYFVRKSFFPSKNGFEEAMVSKDEMERDEALCIQHAKKYGDGQRARGPQ